MAADPGDVGAHSSSRASIGGRQERSGVPAMKILFAIMIPCCFAQGPLTTAVMQNYTEMKENFIQSAAAVPQEKYTFKLTDGQFSFARWLTHSVGANYFYCYRFGNVPLPPRDVLSKMNSL